MLVAKQSLPEKNSGYFFTLDIRQDAIRHQLVKAAKNRLTFLHFFYFFLFLWWGPFGNLLIRRAINQKSFHSKKVLDLFGDFTAKSQMEESSSFSSPIKVHQHRFSTTLRVYLHSDSNESQNDSLRRPWDAGDLHAWPEEGLKAANGKKAGYSRGEKGL